MTATTTRKAITTTAGVLYANPAKIRRKVRNQKVRTVLTHDQKVQVATLMIMTKIPAKLIARMYNISQTTAYNHSVNYRHIIG